MWKWIPFELHTHTNHSDGKHTLMELAEDAKNLGYKGIALTDHSTMSGLLERDSVVSATGIQIIRGMEWTTFYGHVLILNLDTFVDWRDLGPMDLHKRLKTIHDQGGLIGVAHPFRVGSPMCTGCYWNYQVNDWSELDYIEVWSGTFPSISKSNQRAFQLWTDLLNQGYHITAVSGRDWHDPRQVSEPLAATYLAIREAGTDVEGMAIEALKNGAVSVSMGPLPLLYVLSSTQENQWGIGENVLLENRNEKFEIKIDLDNTAWAGHWELEEQPLRVVLYSNLGCLIEFVMPKDKTNMIYKLQPAGLSWIRTELYGMINGIKTMIGFTNPIYFKSIT